MRLLAPFVHEQTLMALRVLNKEWNGMADVLIDEGVESGTMIVHDGNNHCQEDREDLVKQVIFLLNIMKVGKNACRFAANLVVVEHR
ncbi:hypothetical protein TL16_g08728 [Triparma laevis f. inornata]|uniref:Uncharacterized protein n=1 Tax=Triparma laevis f. inornata TaxID=1714386 RepID=A0A9W7EL00_9STRA|nr:hypothetical protein TL16_g08728 [Triparma laevis f. inornata]